MRGAEAVIAALIAEGVSVMTGYPGLGNKPVIDALLERTDAIRPVLTRHERVAIDLIDGYARASGQPVAATVCAGPGAAHAFAGLAQSLADNVPVLLLKAQVPQNRLGNKFHLQTPHLDAFRDVSRFQMAINAVERIPEAIRRAFTVLRSERRGPVVLELPMDVAGAEVPGEWAYQPVARQIRFTADPVEVERAAALLVGARSPYVVVGAGALWAEATDELVALAQALPAPVATTLNGKSVFPENHPLSLGLGGYPRNAMSTPQALYFGLVADVVLGVGNSFMPLASQGEIPSGVKLIHINADSWEIGRVHHTDVGLVGDAKLVLASLVQAVQERFGTAEVERGTVLKETIQSLKAEWLASWKPKVTSAETPMNPYRVTWELMHTVDRPNTIVLHDSGLSRWHISHLYETVAPRTFLGMGGQSEMGWSLGAALGAKLARPDALVVNVMGDGAFGMTGMELETAVREGIPILCIILNNASLGIDKLGYAPGKYRMVDITGDYTGIARALGAHAEKVVSPGQFVPALLNAQRATQEGKPACLEVMAKLEGTFRFE